jgi:hypothetical protein
MPRKPRRTHSRAVLLISVGLIILVSALAMAQYRDPADAPPAPAARPVPADNPTTTRITPYHYSSEEGNFQVTWPSGCGELRIRANEPENFVGEEETHLILIHHATCDQFGAEGEGCSVTAVFDARAADGGEAGPEQVLARVRNALQTFGVKIVKQMPVKREFADGLVVEGVDVLGTDANGKGQFWVRGLLASHDIYLLTAWSADGQLWENAEFQEFFNGFEPFVE